MVAQNLTPVILGIIIAPLVWMIYFFAETVVNTGREKVVGPLKVISARSVEVDKAMSNVKAQSSNKVQVPNIKTFDIKPFGIHLAFACLPEPWRRQGF